MYEKWGEERCESIDTSKRVKTHRHKQTNDVNPSRHVRCNAPPCRETKGFSTAFLEEKEDDHFTDIDYFQLAKDATEKAGWTHDMPMLEPEFDTDGRLSGVVFRDSNDTGASTL